MRVRIFFTVIILCIFRIPARASSLSMLFHSGTEGHIVKAFHHGVTGQCNKSGKIFNCDLIKIDIHSFSSKEKDFLDQIQKVFKYPSESFFEIRNIKGSSGSILSGVMKIGGDNYSIDEGEYFPEEGSLVLSFRMQLSKIGIASTPKFQGKSISDEVSFIVTVPYKK